MEKNPLKDEIRLLVEKSTREKNESLILLEKDYFDGTISRLYYSAFHLALALLMLFGERPKTHNGVIQRFSLLAIDKKVFEKKHAKTLADLFRIRESADYTTISLIEKNDVTELLNRYGEFEKIIKKLVTEMMEKLT